MESRWSHEALNAPAPWTLGEALARAVAAEHIELSQPTSARSSPFEFGLRFLDRRAKPSTFLSWADLEESARRWSAVLASRGVVRHKRVALVLQTSPEFFELFFAIALLGAVPVPLYPPVRLGGPADFNARTAAMLESVDASLLVTDRRIRKRLEGVVDLYSPPLGCLVLDREVLDGGEESASLKPADTPTAGQIEADPDDLALVQFSSGTTGSPRPVGLTHRALLAQARILNSFWAQTETGVQHCGVSWLPLYHDMGLIGGLLPALLRPSKLCLLSPETFVARPAVWLRAISQERATISAAPDFAYRLCVERIRDRDLEGVDLSSWTYALNGAEAVSAETMRNFSERFEPWGFDPMAFTPVYGLAEAALAVTFGGTDGSFVSSRYDREALAAGRAVDAADGVELVSVGRPVPGFEIQLRTAEGAVQPPRRVGHLWSRGPSLMSGYLGQAEATARTLRDGWMDTGDLGFVDGDELFLCGRSKDVLVLNGRNYDPAWVEKSAGEIEGIQWGGAVAVSWVPGASQGEELLLFAEQSLPAKKTAEEIERECRAQVLSDTGLRVARFVLLEPGSLPRTSSGKNRRAAALDCFEAGDFAEVGAAGVR